MNTSFPNSFWVSYIHRFVWRYKTVPVEPVMVVSISSINSPNKPINNTEIIFMFTYYLAFILTLHTFADFSSSQLKCLYITGNKLTSIFNLQMISIKWLDFCLKINVILILAFTIWNALIIMVCLISFSLLMTNIHIEIINPLKKWSMYAVIIFLSLRTLE